MELKEKIILEKRKRHQIYTTLNYLRSHKNKFDFFSTDALTILKLGKEICKKFNQDKLTTEILLLSFFNTDCDLTDIIHKYNINFQTVQRYIINGYELQNNTNFKKKAKKSFLLISNIKNVISSTFHDKILINSTVPCNYEVKIILEKAIENAYRFKTPVITAEILFLTLMEERETSAGQLLKLILKNDLNWSLLRYELLKKLHNQETLIQGNIFKNTRFYAYLLKIEMTDEQFEKLLEKKDFSNIVSSYRDLVVSRVLESDIFDTLEKEVNYSINVNRKDRKYSI
jgi:hypothetical protein